MPTWFYIALLSPILWALVNHLDKYATTKFKINFGVEGIVILMNLFSIIIVPAIYFLTTNLSAVSFENKILLILTGIANSLAGYCYLYAILDDEASIVAPLFQLIPVFGFILSCIFLGEYFTSAQVSGSIILLVGSTLLMLRFPKESKKPRLKIVVGVLMIISTFLYASSQVLFKYIALTEKYWNSLFWQYLGILLSAFILLSIKRFRHNFINGFKIDKFRFFKVVTIIQILNMSANMIALYATLLAPVALILLVNSYQPLFVFLIGVILTLYFPSLGKEDIQRRQLLYKSLCMAIMIVGTYFLYYKQT